VTEVGPNLSEPFSKLRLEARPSSVDDQIPKKNPAREDEGFLCWRLAGGSALIIR
jgi:hypothetical protein